MWYPPKCSILHYSYPIIIEQKIPFLLLKKSSKFHVLENFIKTPSIHNISILIPMVWPIKAHMKTKKKKCSKKRDMQNIYGSLDILLVCFVVKNVKPEHWRNETACKEQLECHIFESECYLCNYLELFYENLFWAIIKVFSKRFLPTTITWISND